MEQEKTTDPAREVHGSDFLALAEAAMTQQEVENHRRPCAHDVSLEHTKGVMKEWLSSGSDEEAFTFRIPETTDTTEVAELLIMQRESPRA